jgi:hypothetical protein
MEDRHSVRETAGAAPAPAWDHVNQSGSLLLSPLDTLNTQRAL